ncbi:hypothetical protein HOG98_06495 [bacterium]|jgi:hypothetical protein|nr:hypothetical protein [bacterium]
MFKYTRTPMYAPSIQKLLTNSMQISDNIRATKIVLAQEKLDKLHNETNKFKMSELATYYEAVDVQGLTPSSTSGYSGSGDKMSFNAAGWHFNFGKLALLPTLGLNLDIQTVCDILNKELPSNTPLILEDRGAGTGDNLINILCRLQKKHPNITGIGSEINFPCIIRGKSTINYLDLQNIIDIGFGSITAISPTISGSTKAVLMTNLLSVLSPNEGIEALRNAAQSLSQGDIIFLTVYPNNRRTILNVVPESRKFVEISNTKEVTHYQQSLITPDKLKELLDNTEMGRGKNGFDPLLFTEDPLKVDGMNQNMTFYSKNGIISILKDLDLVINSDLIYTGNNSGDNVERIYIVAKKQ